MSWLPEGLEGLGWGVFTGGQGAASADESQDTAEASAGTEPIIASQVVSGDAAPAESSDEQAAASSDSAEERQVAAAPQVADQERQAPDTVAAEDPSEGSDEAAKVGCNPTDAEESPASGKASSEASRPASAEEEDWCLVKEEEAAAAPSSAEAQDRAVTPPTTKAENGEKEHEKKKEEEATTEEVAIVKASTEEEKRRQRIDRCNQAKQERAAAREKETARNKEMLGQLRESADWFNDGCPAGVRGFLRNSQKPVQLSEEHGKLIIIMPAPHGFKTGDTISLWNVHKDEQAICQALNKEHVVTVINSTTFRLDDVEADISSKVTMGTLEDAMVLPDPIQWTRENPRLSYYLACKGMDVAKFLQESTVVKSVVVPFWARARNQLWAAAQQLQQEIMERSGASAACDSLAQQYDVLANSGVAVALASRIPDAATLWDYMQPVHWQRLSDAEECSNCAELFPKPDDPSIVKVNCHDCGFVICKKCFNIEHTVPWRGFWEAVPVCKVCQPQVDVRNQVYSQKEALLKTIKTRAPGPGLTFEAVAPKRRALPPGPPPKPKAKPQAKSQARPEPKPEPKPEPEPPAGEEQPPPEPEPQIIEPSKDLKVLLHIRTQSLKFDNFHKFKRLFETLNLQIIREEEKESWLVGALEMNCEESYLQMFHNHFKARTKKTEEMQAAAVAFLLELGKENKSALDRCKFLNLARQWHYLSKGWTSTDSDVFPPELVYTAVLEGEDVISRLLAIWVGGSRTSKCVEEALDIVKDPEQTKRSKLRKILEDETLDLESFSNLKRQIDQKGEYKMPALAQDLFTERGGHILYDTKKLRDSLALGTKDTEVLQACDALLSELNAAKDKVQEVLGKASHILKNRGYGIPEQLHDVATRVDETVERVGTLASMTVSKLEAQKAFERAQADKEAQHADGPTRRRTVQNVLPSAASSSPSQPAAAAAAAPPLVVNQPNPPPTPPAKKKPAARKASKAGSTSGATTTTASEAAVSAASAASAAPPCDLLSDDVANVDSTTVAAAIPAAPLVEGRHESLELEPQVELEQQQQQQQSAVLEEADFASAEEDEEDEEHEDHEEHEDEACERQKRADHEAADEELESKPAAPSEADRV